MDPVAIDLHQTSGGAGQALSGETAARFEGGCKNGCQKHVSHAPNPLDLGGLFQCQLCVCSETFFSASPTLKLAGAPRGGNSLKDVTKPPT